MTLAKQQVCKTYPTTGIWHAPPDGGACMCMRTPGCWGAWRGSSMMVVEAANPPEHLHHNNADMHPCLCLVFDPFVCLIRRMLCTSALHHPIFVGVPQHAIAYHAIHPCCMLHSFCIHFMILAWHQIPQLQQGLLQGGMNGCWLHQQLNSC